MKKNSLSNPEWKLLNKIIDGVNDESYDALENLINTNKELINSKMVDALIKLPISQQIIQTHVSLYKAFIEVSTPHKKNFNLLNMIRYETIKGVLMEMDGD